MHWGSVQAVQPIGGIEVWLYLFMTTALEGGEGSASRPGRSLPPGKTRYPLYRRLGGPQGRSGQVRKISPPPGFDSRTVQPVASRYTDWATRPTLPTWMIKYSMFSTTSRHDTVLRNVYVSARVCRTTSLDGQPSVLLTRSLVSQGKDHETYWSGVSLRLRASLLPVKKTNYLLRTDIWPQVCR